MDGNWRYHIIKDDFVVCDYENGLNNTQTSFSKTWTAEVSEELTKINIFLYWSTNFDGNTEEVLGTLCYFDVFDFKIEEIVYPENFDKYSLAINSNENCIFSYDIYDSPYPITIEADKIYKITGKVIFDKSEKGNPTELSINCNATDLEMSFASEKCPNDENGLNNKSEEEFELVYIFSNSGEITKFQYSMYWSKELDGNTDDVIGSLCFFKIVDFNVEELAELPQE